MSTRVRLPAFFGFAAAFAVAGFGFAPSPVPGPGGPLVAQELVGQYAQADVEAGFGLYNANCITCHGANGDSVSGVDLRSGQFRRASTDSDLNALIQTGIPGTAMPPGGRFSTVELAGLVIGKRAGSASLAPAKSLSG